MPSQQMEDTGLYAISKNDGVRGMVVLHFSCNVHCDTITCLTL